MKISREGVLLIKSFEGFHPRAWQSSDGRWVVGYGHTASTREGISVSQADAELLLQYDLIPVQTALAAHLTRPVNQHQYDALASFAFSVGPEAFASSDVLTRVNAGEDADAVEALTAWPEAPVREAGLRRRAAERALFNADPSAPVALADLLSAPITVARPTRIEGSVETRLPEAVTEAVNDDAVEAPVAGNVSNAESSTSRDIPILAPTAGFVPLTDPDVVETVPETAPLAAVLAETVRPDDAVSMPVPEDAEVVDAGAASSEGLAETAVAGTVVEGTIVEGMGIAQTAITRPHLAWPRDDTAPPVDQSVVETVVEPESLDAPAVVLPSTIEALDPSAPEGAAPTEPLTPLQTPVSTQIETETPSLFEDSGETQAATETVGWGEPFDRKPAGFSWRRVWAYMVMGGFGLVSLAMAMAALRKASMAQTDVTSILVIAGVLAFIGAVCVGVSAQNIYRRLSDDR